MPERHVIHAVEQARADLTDPADRDVALALARRSPGDPRMAHDDGPLQAREPPDRRARNPWPASALRHAHGRSAPPAARDRRAAARAPTRARDTAARRPRPRRSRRTAAPETPPAADRCADAPRRIDERGAEAEAGGRIMISADDHDPGAGITQADERVFTQLHGVERRHRAVIDITAHEHGVDPLRARRRDQRIEELGLRFPQVSAVKGAAEMPVGGVKESHMRTVGRATDKIAKHGRRPARLQECVRSSSGSARPVSRSRVKSSARSARAACARRGQGRRRHRAGARAGEQDPHAADPGRRAFGGGRGRAAAGHQPVHALRRHPQGTPAVVERCRARTRRRAAGGRGGGQLRQLGATVATGVFGAQMRVSLVNEGPFTLVVDV